MANLTKFSKPEEQPDIPQMFSQIAPRYDFLNRLMTFGLDRHWRSKTVALMPVSADPMRFLDLATGTADLALSLAEDLRRRTGGLAFQIEAVDPSPIMLDLARQKVQKSAFHDIFTLRLGLMEELPFPSNVFDGVTIGFGIRNAADRNKAIAEIHRVLKPGGQLLILEALPPENLLQRLLQRLHMRLGVRLLGKMFSSVNAYEYLGNSVAQFPIAPEFIEILQRAGFQSLGYHSLTFGAVGIFSATK